MFQKVKLVLELQVCEGKLQLQVHALTHTQSKSAV